MQLRKNLVKIACAFVSVICLSVPALSNEVDCPKLLYNHGFASSAQFNCGFEFYNDNVITQARQCMADADEYGESDRLSEALASGLKDFNAEYEATDGKHNLCVDFAENYPSFVHP